MNPVIIHRVATDDIRTQDIFDEEESEYEIPEIVEHIVFQQVYGAMMKSIREYGNPNIPLGTTDGKKCKTLRSLYQKNKLSSGEIDLLKSLGFRLTQLDEIYEVADFNDIYGRLKLFQKENPDLKMQVPKKYKPDPELGAWVAIARRVGPNGVGPDRRKKLDEIGFAWESNRKCGSVFMTNFRCIRESLDEAYQESIDNGEEVFDGLEVLKDDKEALKWLRAQKEAYGFGNLSEARAQYMDQFNFYGVEWRQM